MLGEQIQKKYRIQIVVGNSITIKKPTTKESKKAQNFYDKYLAGDADAPTFVAVVNNEMVGAIWLHSFYFFYFPKMERDINEFDVIVHPDWKRKGIAKQLINKAKTTSKLPLIAKPSTKEGINGSISFISPKAYKEEKTYLLEKKKEPKADMTLTAEEKKLIEDYVPDLGDHTSFRNPMPIDKIKTQASKMSDDDLAWHLLTSKKALALGDEDFVRERFGFREICVLQLMNKNITKKERTEIAEYMIDKMCVSFVGGPTLKQYIVALTKSGAIDKKMLQGGQDDEMQSDIYYGKITDPVCFKPLAASNFKRVR